MYKILSFDQAARRTSGTLEFLTLAPTPHNETCTAAGESHEDGIKECIALINQLQRIHGQAPAGAEFFVVRNYHEFGTYFEAGIFYEVLQEPTQYDIDNETEVFYKQWDADKDETESQEYAMKIETGIPDNWDAEALQELREMQHSQYQPAKIIQLKRA